MFSRNIAAVVLGFGAVALSGCGGGTMAASTPTATTTPTATVPPLSGGTYPTVLALKNAFVKAGGTCADFKQTNRITLAAESAECSSNTVISTYVNSSDISQLIQTNKKLNEEYKFSDRSSWLVGENWVINSPTASQFQEKLGGKVVSF